MKIKRVFLFVLDSLGIGEAPDAAEFGDGGASTLGAVSRSGLLKIDNLTRLGLGNIDGIDYIESTDSPIGSYARMTEASMGKDTIIGHWEIGGHISDTPLPTYPEGFPKELLDRFSKLCGRGILCNMPYSGTEVIKDFGREHIESGDLIVYTSADSVFQIAAHTDVISINELYSICEKARELLVGEHSVGRVIARPFDSTYPNYRRLPERRDFSLVPPICLLPEAVFKGGLASYSIGKISDIFADRLFTKATHTSSNAEGQSLALSMLDVDFNGLCFVNLVDFDSKFGHRRDSNGYASALNEFDAILPEFISKMKDSDILFITADHGCDPSFTATTDHTREYTPLLIYSLNLISKNYGTRNTFADIGATIADLLDIDLHSDGTPLKLEFKEQI